MSRVNFLKQLDMLMRTSSKQLHNTDLRTDVALHTGPLGVGNCAWNW